MNTYRAEATALIKASAAQVYGIIADYYNGHPYILPQPYFSNLEVEQGGIGAGTHIRFKMSVMGQTRVVKGVVTEPEPGRVLVETYPADNIVTTFTVIPVEQGHHAQVTFTTVGPTRGGLAGVVERMMIVMLLKRIYRKELKLLAQVAAERANATANAPASA